MSPHRWSQSFPHRWYLLKAYFSSFILVEFILNMTKFRIMMHFWISFIFKWFQNSFSPTEKFLHFRVKKGLFFFIIFLFVRIVLTIDSIPMNNSINFALLWFKQFTISIKRFYYSLFVVLKSNHTFFFTIAGYFETLIFEYSNQIISSLLLQWIFRIIDHSTRITRNNWFKRLWSFHRFIQFFLFRSALILH